MFPFLSLTVAIKDYLEIIHQLIALDASSNIKNYTDIGPVLVYAILSLKQFILSILSFNWLQNLWTLPVIVPDITSAMISEISVLDGYFHTAFTFLDNPTIATTSIISISFQKLIIGFGNSLFLCLPTSVAHIITLRRFLIQGLEAGYISGLGVVSGNIFFLASVIFGWRFFLIPWISLDIFRYIFGFILLVKYIWDSANERRMVLEDLSKWKIFLITFLLSLTEQTSIFPFISNLSFGTDATVLESFSANSFTEFIIVHSCYLLGILIGSLSLLHLSCWFWENPAFQIYMWAISSFKVKTGSFYKYLNFGLLYLTMLSAISSIPYFGLDYTLTSPFGLVFEDRILEEKVFNELSFLNTGPTDRNTRRNRGRHPRRSRWNRRTRKYRSFQTNLYEKENYDWMTIEDLNFGFDRQWIHRKMRNHRARYRLFPGKLTRSLKDQARKAFTKRHAFFDTTENYFYHPSFHEYTKQKSNESISLNPQTFTTSNPISTSNTLINSIVPYIENKNDVDNNSALNKFNRKVATKIASAQTIFGLNNAFNLAQTKYDIQQQTNTISSQRWKRIFTNIEDSKTTNKLRNFYKKMVLGKGDNALRIQQRLQLSKKDRFMLRYRTFLYSNQRSNINKYSGEVLGKELLENNSFVSTSLNQNNIFWKPGTLLHPIKYYLQKEQAYNKKLQYYGVKNFRTFAPDYSPPLFRVIMQRYFYSYKPTKRWSRTLKGATMRRYLRKSTRKPRILQTSQLNDKDIITQSNINNSNVTINTSLVENTSVQSNNISSPTQNIEISQTKNLIRKPTHFYSMKGKRASRYRYQIYRDVLQHWYYSPLNRILPKIDIDSFIRRQPANHFITPTEEKILHLRRFLVSEHYDTLRWYTAMQQYTQMKNRIGGTKSLSSRTYNQQFFGNFKKIRHLFAVTPSLNDQPVLTFDQTLYNEYENTVLKPIIDTSILHEELLADDLYTNTKGIQPNDILNQSLVIIKEYLNIANPIRQELIGNYLKNKNYWELTQFLYKGQKTRGFKSITNERDLIEQEKNYLLTNITTDKIDYALITNSKTLNNLQQSTVVALLRKWKQSLGNQRLYKKALKNQFKNWRRQKKRWRKKLEKYSNRNVYNETKISLGRVSTVPSGIQKAITDANNTLSLVEKTEKFNIGQVRNQSTIQLENKMKNVLVKLRDLKLREEVNPSLLQTKVLNKLRKKLEKQIINTNQKVKKLYIKTKNKTWWNKKSTESWRPTRRRLDIDSLRKRIKRKSDQSQVLNYQETLKQDFYTNYYAKEKLNNESFNFKTKGLSSETPNISESSNDFNWQILTQNNSINIIRQKQIEKSRNSDQLDSTNLNWNDGLKTNKLESSSLLRQFKRKRVSRRRGRKLGPAGYSRRPNLSTLVKRQINAPNNINNANLIRKDFNLNKADSFELIPQKVRYFRKRKHRDWEKKIKPNNGIKTGKYRKRKLSFYGKVRSVQKQLIRVRWKLRLQKWWWQFLPAMQGAIDTKWQVEYDKTLISTLEKLTEKQILKRDQISYNNKAENVLGDNRLQIGDQDFKPLQVPEAIRIRNELEQQGRLKFGSVDNIIANNQQNPNMNLSESSNENNIVNQLTTNLLSNGSSVDIKQSSPKMQITNAVPFYAGWDESLRKLVITNVLFSLRDASFEMKNLQKFETLKPLGINELEFTNAPLKAQNGATTVYWQTPFTTYETDQFFTLGVDGFSPLQWRRFNFKQSIVKNWKTERNNEKQTLPILVKTLTKDKSSDYLVNNSKNINLNEIVSSDKPEFGKIKTSAIYRRRQKRYKRVRRHPRAPVWYPSGALISDVLPTQYVYAFDYTARRPRDRYIQRRWRKRSQIGSEISNNNLQMDKITDFTLRRRPNGRRKYHRRGGKLRSLLTVAYPMRRKMVGLETEMERWRPERIKKETGYATKLEEVRKRRGMSLRRRKLRQVFPKITRYRPLNGGFVWPGEYLMLEQSKVPKLKQINLDTLKTQDALKAKKGKSKKLRRKIKRKSRNIAQWNIQPKKYLLQKHNIKVLKKKLQKSYRTNQLQLKLRQLSLTI